MPPDPQEGDNNTHLKAGFVSPSQIIPTINGELGLSAWQNIFFCKLDGRH